MIKYKISVTVKAFTIENIFQSQIIFNWLDFFFNLKFKKFRILILELNKNKNKFDFGFKKYSKLLEIKYGICDYFLTYLK